MKRERCLIDGFYEYEISLAEGRLLYRLYVEACNRLTRWQLSSLDKFMQSKAAALEGSLEIEQCVEGQANESLGLTCSIFNPDTKESFVYTESDLTHLFCSIINTLNCVFDRSEEFEATEESEQVEPEKPDQACPPEPSSENLKKMIDELDIDYHDGPTN